MPASIVAASSNSCAFLKNAFLRSISTSVIPIVTVYRKTISTFTNIRTASEVTFRGRLRRRNGIVGDRLSKKF